MIHKNELFVDFLSKMLNLNPRMRLAPDVLLNNDYLKN
jgi:hypothetical protein